MPLPFSKAILRYDDQEQTLTPGKKSFFDELYVDFSIEQTAGGERYQLMIHPKQDVTLKGLSLYFSYAYTAKDKIFCNGYQSWSESREYQVGEQIPRLRRMARPLMKYFGDEHINGIPRGKGHLHSWTYSYIRQGDRYQLIGSLKEKSAFTLIDHDTVSGQVCVQMDCEGLELSHSFPALDLFVGEGKEAAVFDQYFGLMDFPKPKAPVLTGWTSWYHYYKDISEKIILQNLEAFAEKEVAADIIQIDDGYQQKVGDWLKISEDFPNGMGKVARKIHDKGFKAGLWLAPFVCEKESDLFKNKKNWLLKDAKGQPLRVGYMPLWSGWFYALDFYHPKVQEYLTGIFHVIFSKWGFDLLKLDFLYAVCLLPRPNKTRGQIMHEAMAFIRNLAGDKLLLGCGLPLGSAFGLVDYCRIGADIHLRWEHGLLHFLRNRERVSTEIALQSTIGRRQLNERAFGNDPDVFILRTEKNELTPDQQFTILLINSLLGNLLFTSDYLGDYTAEQWSEFELLFSWKNSQVKKVTPTDRQGWVIEFSNAQGQFLAFCNLSSKQQRITYLKKSANLEPYESMILKK